MEAEYRHTAALLAAAAQSVHDWDGSDCSCLISPAKAMTSFLDKVFVSQVLSRDGATKLLDEALNTIVLWQERRQLDLYVAASLSQILEKAVLQPLAKQWSERCNPLLSHLSVRKARVLQCGMCQSGKLQERYQGHYNNSEDESLAADLCLFRQDMMRTVCVVLHHESFAKEALARTS